MKSKSRHDVSATQNGPQVEALEPRLMLSAAVAIPYNIGSPLRQLLDPVYEQIVELLPDDIKEAVAPILNGLMQSTAAAYTYQAFPGEVNDVKIWGELGNTLLLTDESKDVTLFRLGTYSFEPIEKISFKPGVKAEGGGSFVGHIAAGLGLEFDGVIDSLLKGWFDLAKPRVVTLNGFTLLNLIPQAADIANIIDSFLDFSISDLIPSEITVIPPIYFFGEKVWDGWTIDIESLLPWTQDIPTVGDLIEWTMPPPVRDIFDAIQGVQDILQSTFVTDGVYVSALDGNDRIDLSKLTGIPQTVHGDMGNDTILCGGGQDVLDSWGVPFLGGRANREILLYGDSGNDAFIINRLYDSLKTRIDGGSGSDRLVIQGSDASDIIRLIADENGNLGEIRFETPNSLAGSPTNEVQTFAMPSEVVGGSFILKADGWPDTSPISWNASAAVVETGLAFAASQADPTLNIGDIKVTGGGGTWEVEFLGDLSGFNLAPLVVDGRGLERRVTGAAVTTERDGGDGAGQPIANEMQKITLPAGVTGGTFTVQFDTYPETSAIPYNAGHGDVELALLGTGMARSDFEVAGAYGGPWQIEFTGGLELTDVPQVVVDASGLWGGLDDWDATRTQQGLKQTNTVQQITVPAEATGGTFRVTVQAGSATRATDVPYNATALELEDAIKALGTVGPGNVDVTRTPQGSFRVEFLNDLGGATQVAMAVDGSGLLGVNISQTQPGGGGDNEIQQIALAAGAQGGEFRLHFGGQVTAALLTTATAGEIDAALELLPAIGANNVTVTGPAGGPWSVEFINAMADSDVAMLGAELVVATLAVSAGTDGVNEVQTLAIPASANDGHLRLIVTTRFGAAATVVEYDTDAQGLQDALEGLTVVGEGNVQVQQIGPRTFEITFVDDLGAWPTDPITVDTRFLAGGGVATVREYSPLVVNELQKVQVTHTQAQVGTFTLALSGQGTSGPIDFNASVADVQQALEATFGAGSVAVTGEPRTWEIEFIGALGARDLPEMTVAGGQINVSGAEVEVTELTSGNDGENTTVLATTKFTGGTGTLEMGLIDVELFEINGAGGNDTLIIDCTKGPIHFRDGINFSGGSGLNEIFLIGDAAKTATVSEHKSGKSTITFGPNAEDTQVLTYSSCRVYDFLPADEMVLKGSPDGDSVEVEQDDYEGNTVGLIRSTGGPGRLYFTDKTKLTITTLAGDDSVTWNAGDLPAGVQAVTIDTGSSTGGDALLINGTGADDVFDFTPTSMKGGTMDLSLGGRAVAVELAGLESLNINAWQHDVLADTLILHAVDAAIVPGDFPGTGDITARSVAGQPRLSVQYADVEDVQLRAMNVVAFDGTGGDDVVTVTPDAVTFIDIFGRPNVTSIVGAEIVWLHLMDGNDLVTVTAATPLGFQLEILAGGSDLGGDKLVYSGAGGDLAMNFDDPTLTEANGSQVVFWGMETFDVDTLGGALSLATGQDDETLVVAPLDDDSGRFELADDLLSVRYAGLAGQRLGVDLAAGEDILVVRGSAADDIIVLDANGITFVDDGRALAYTDVEAVTVDTLQGDDQLDVDNTAGLVALPGGVQFVGGMGMDTLRLTGGTVVDEAIYAGGPGDLAGTVVHHLGTQRQVTAFDGVESIIDLVPGPLTVNGTGLSDVINYDVGLNTATALVDGLDSAQIWVDDYQSIEFARKTSLAINALAGHDTVDLNNAPRPADLAEITVDGGSGNDLLIGGAGDDRLIGGRGNDTISGLDGNDEIFGGSGDDTLDGAAGNDLLNGQEGNDTLIGGHGIDTAEFIATDQANQVHVTDTSVTVDDDVNGIEGFEHLTLDTLGGDDTVVMDAGDAFVPDVVVRLGEGDDAVEINLANPGPATRILVDGGPHNQGDTGVVRGWTGEDQFEVFDPLYFFGDASVEFVDIENRSVLEGARIDTDWRTIEIDTFRFRDADRNLTVVAVYGPGHVDIFRDLVNGRDADIHSMVLTDTREDMTALAVHVRTEPGADNETSIGFIRGDGAYSIHAVRSDLVGDGIHLTGGLAQLTLDDIADGAVLTFGGKSGRSLSVIADVVGDVDFTTTQTLVMNVGSWADGTIQAAMFQSVVSARGDFFADLINTQQTRYGYGLAYLWVNGNLATNILADRIYRVHVTNGDVLLNVAISPDVETWPSPVVFTLLTISGGDLLGANVNLPAGTGMGSLIVQRAGGVGGNVVGPVNITGGLGVAYVAGNVGGGNWDIGGPMNWMYVGGDLAADLTIQGADPAGYALRNLTTVGKIVDSTVTALDGGIHYVQTAQWDRGSLTARWLYGLVTTGAGADPLIDGRVGADLNLTGAGPNGYSMVYAHVAGQIACDWTFASGVGMIYAASTADTWTLDAAAGVTHVTIIGRLDGNLTARHYTSIYAGGALGAAITATGANAAGMSIVSLSVGVADNVALTVPGGIAVFSLAGSVGGGTVNAEWITSLISRGDVDFDLTLTGAAANGYALIAGTIVGSILGGAWDLGGNASLIYATGQTTAAWQLNTAGFVNSLYALAALRGGVTAQYINAAVTTGDLAADFDLTGKNASGMSLGSLLAGQVIGNVQLKAAGVVNLIQVWQWLTGRIEAAGVNTMVTLGNAALAVDGHFGAEVILSGAGAPAWLSTFGYAYIAGNLVSNLWDITGRLGTLYVAGAVKGTAANPLTIRSTGSMTTVMAGTFEHANFLAGIHAGAGDHATVAADFADPDASMGTVMVLGQGDHGGRFLTGTNFSAASFGYVRVLNANIPAGGLGFYALDSADDDELNVMVYHDTVRGDYWAYSTHGPTPYPGPADFWHVIPA